MSGPQSPSPDGKLDVTPSTLYGVSGEVAAYQGIFHKGGNSFLAELARYPDCGGYGSSATAFAAAYKEVGERFMDVWAKCVVGVGGAAVGFTVTANNFAKADAATNPSGPPPSERPPPTVIEKAPDYRAVTDLSWGDWDDGQSVWQAALEGLEGVALAVLRPLLEEACRWGKAAEILPLPDYQGLDSLSKVWQLSPMATIGTVDGGLTNSLARITDQSNSEWQTAMRKFCGSLWGTTAWGKRRDGYQWHHYEGKEGMRSVSQPVMAVLNDTSKEISAALEAWSHAAKAARDDLRRIFYQAVRDALPHIDTSDGIGMKDLKSFGKGLLNMGKSFGEGIVLEIDEDAMNATVEAYKNRVERQVPELKKLMPALDEAYTSAPTFKAESARANSFGARALTDFKGNPLYTVPGEKEADHKYPVDLANQEGVSGAHVIDKHVAKTDEQLEQRLRDQQITRHGVTRPAAASTFLSLQDAQQYTQQVLDDPENQRRIGRWLAKDPDPASSTREVGLEFDHPVGRTWERGESGAHSTRNVSVVLRPVRGGKPPYVVLTSMPTDQPPPE